jgi:2-polyprenyl-6-methoxyphenol hydroxylase-like FAD-dependent oxidoreductase
MFVFPQDQHERLLIGALAEAGVQVERGLELTGFTETEGGVRAVLQDGQGARQACEAAYIAGCDGARSRTREVIGANFPGGTYSQLFYVADVQASGEAIDGALNIDLDESDFLAIFPMKAQGRVRLIGVVRDARAANPEALTFADVSDRAIQQLKLKIDQVNGFSTYHVHHRVADRFRRGRAFLLGDAAHIHSPAGGQGMNTGIGDAVNLAWKLAAVVKAKAPAALLDSYEPERIGFARRLVATTDQVFTLASSPGEAAKRIRTLAVPRLAPALMGLGVVRRFAFRTVSQLAVNYRHGPLSAGAAGEVWGGDRLPWTRFKDGRDNFAPLTALAWQVHVYGEAPEGLAEVCAEQGLPLHAFAWEPGIRKAGLKRGALYLVRPDGYVALADPLGNAARLVQYMDAQEIELGDAGGRLIAQPRPALVEGSTSPVVLWDQR